MALGVTPDKNNTQQSLKFPTPTSRLQLASIIKVTV